MTRKIWIIFIGTFFASSIFASCCMICHPMLNTDGSITDCYFSNESVVFESKTGYELNSDKISVSNDDFLYCIKFFIRDSSYYQMGNDPDIVINSLSFMTTNGDVIPYNLYNYKDKGERWSMDTMDLSPNLFPIRITRNMKESVNGMHYYSFFALCQINKMNKIYVNYDIDVYGKHYVMHSLYRRKVVLDCRPKFW